MDWNVQKPTDPSADYLTIKPPPYVNLDLYYAEKQNKVVNHKKDCIFQKQNEDENMKEDGDIYSNEKKCKT